MIDGFSSHFIENPAKDENGAYLASLDRIYTDIEVMQYTGLKDKNGKEIFESDIITAHTKGHFQYPHRGVVEYVDSYFAIKVKDDSVEDGHAYTPLMFNMDFEVVGNIYESPEKLRKETTHDEGKQDQPERPE